MSSFFTAPPSQKRKRAHGDARSRRAPQKPVSRGPSRPLRDESISGSDDEDDEAPERPTQDLSDVDDSDEDDFDGEDPAAKRIRLAEQYLANTQNEILDEAGFDAADIDKEILASRMGERLKQDTAETKGKLYRWIADDFDYPKAVRTQFRHHQKSVTGVAVAGEYCYTVGRDVNLVKWRLPQSGMRSDGRSRKPEKVAVSKAGGKSRADGDMHSKAILCVAASQDGKFVATGGVDKKLIIWDAATLKPLKVFLYQNSHRDTIESLAFRRGTNQLFSASRDRTVKIWSLDELAYVETLFGHQDEVADVSALAQEKCVTVGARDRTARLWKVVEESQLVFRGGGAPRRTKNLPNGSDSGIDLQQDAAPHEGSMDRIACIDDETFITGSDSGSLSLWNIHKKKPIHTYPLAHGMDTPLPLELVSAEEEPPADARPQPTARWITALRAVPFSNVFVTGSWDGSVRAWRLSADKRRIEPLGRLGCVESSVDNMLDEFGLNPASLSNGALQAMKDGTERHGVVSGIVNDLAIVDRGERARDGLLVVAAVGKDHRLGRWKEVEHGKNYSVMFEIPRKVLSSSEESSEGEGTAADADHEIDGFE